MALIKSITNSKNQAFAYHKIDFSSLRFSELAGDVYVQFDVLSYKDKTTRDSTDPVYLGEQFMEFKALLFTDIRADQASAFDGLYTLLKAQAAFENAEDDI